MTEGVELYSNVLSQDDATLLAGPMRPFNHARVFSILRRGIVAALLFRSVADRVIASCWRAAGQAARRS
jgi:hypothetical protein